LRMVPSEATGLSPFLAKQGWEPTTPLSLLFDAWIDEDMEELELVDFVLDNSMRVEELREEASLKLRENGEKRKRVWDLKAKVREFKEGDDVLMRKAGMNGKLETSWEGPYKIVAKNTPLSYKVNLGDRVVPSAHISLLKKFERNEESVVVARTTTVMDPDTVGDEISERYAEVKVSGSEGMCARQREELKGILDKFESTLTKEPGLTDRVKFSVDTGDVA